MTGAAHPLLECSGLAVRIGARTLVTGLDVAVRQGEIWAVVGKNGAGKSLLLATLAGLRRPASGIVRYGGAAIDSLGVRARALHRGYLPQNTVDFFPATVAETVMIGRHPHIGRIRPEAPADFAAAEAALRAMAVAEFAAREVATLSGGERRRVALAGIVAQDPALLLLDEPSSHLDLGAQIAALDALARLARERGKAIVMVVHDLHLALRYADHAITVGEGIARAGPAAQMLSASAMSALFGHRLAELGGGTARTLVPE